MTTLPLCGYIIIILESQSKEILQRKSLPEKLRIAVAENIENNLFSQVAYFLVGYSKITKIENMHMRDDDDTSMSSLFKWGVW